MLIEVLTPEEEIIAWFGKALSEELTEMIKILNEERGEIWAEPLAEITREENTRARIPKAFIRITKVKKKTVDIRFTREEYLINLKLTFHDNDERTTGYRYNYMMGRLIKESDDLQKIADRIIIDELIYNQNTRGDNRETSTAEFKIIMIKETA